MLRRAMLSIAPLALLALPAAAAPDRPAARVPKDLLRQRVEAARKAFELNRAWTQNDSSAAGELFGWSERWLEAELALGEGDEGRVKALRDHLDRTREVERMAADKVRAGVGLQAHAHAATYYRLEAEVRMTKEGVEPHPAKGLGGAPEKR